MVKKKEVASDKAISKAQPKDTAQKTKEKRKTKPDDIDKTITEAEEKSREEKKKKENFDIEGVLGLKKKPALQIKGLSKSFKKKLVDID